jgi:hypothetical protein
VCENAAVPGVQARPVASSPNIYRPHLMRVAVARDETVDVRTLRLEFVDPKAAETFEFRVGQFGLYNALGEGDLEVRALVGGEDEIALLARDFNRMAKHLEQAKNLRCPSKNSMCFCQKSEIKPNCLE